VKSASSVKCPTCRVADARRDFGVCRARLPLLTAHVVKNPLYLAAYCRLSSFLSLPGDIQHRPDYRDQKRLSQSRKPKPGHPWFRFSGVEIPTCSALLFTQVSVISGSRRNTSFA
jgi:hypothetical protein